MLLSQLINHDQPLTLDPEITGLSLDSRLTQKGDLFFAVPGFSFDGQEFIEAALLKGASAIITQGKLTENYPVPVICVDHIRKTISEIANRFYPQKPETIIMITGTNGKSTTVSFLQQLWCLLGYKAASIGTLGVQSALGDPQLSRDYKLTSPDAITLHMLLAELQEQGFTHVAIEATSIGLDQYRVHNVPIKAAAFTNFTQDHLDYHKTLKTYFGAKTKLFTDILPADKPAVLNRDIPEYTQLLENVSAHPVLSFGMHDASDLKLISHKPHLEGQTLWLSWKNQTREVDFPLWGDFQVSNLLAALAPALSTGSDFNALLPLVSQLKNVPGRLERVLNSHIFVDYAHTPDALESAILALRPHTPRKIGVVFGCGGDRDTSKRKIMGQIAEKHADFVIVTDDNPRSEDPVKIRAEIMSGCPNALEVPDRKEAIKSGMTNLDSQNILIVAGKGHETGQIIGDQTHPFNDVDVIEELLGTYTHE